MDGSSTAAASLHAPINLTNFTDRLPVEIIGNILRHFVIEDLRDISVCNKAWRRRAIPILFRFMDLRSVTNFTLRQMSDDFDAPARIFQSCHHLYLSLNPIAVEDDENDAVHAKLFILLDLITHMPNLRRLAIEHAGDGHSSKVAAFVKLLPSRQPPLQLSCRLKALDDISASFWTTLSKLRHIGYGKLMLEDDAGAVSSLSAAIYSFSKLELVDCLAPPRPSTRSTSLLREITIVNTRSAVEDPRQMSLSSALRTASDRGHNLHKMKIYVWEPSLVRAATFMRSGWNLVFPALTALNLKVATDQPEADHASIANLLGVIRGPMLRHLTLDSWYPATTLPVRTFMHNHRSLKELVLAIICDGTSGHKKQIEAESNEIHELVILHPGLSIEIHCLTWPWRLGSADDKRSLQPLFQFLSEQAGRLGSIQVPEVGYDKILPCAPPTPSSMPHLNELFFYTNTLADSRIGNLVAHMCDAPCLEKINLIINEWDELVHKAFFYELENLIAVSYFPSLVSVSGTVTNSEGWENKPYSVTRVQFMNVLRKAGIGASELYWEGSGKAVVRRKAWD